MKVPNLTFLLPNLIHVQANLCLASIGKLILLTLIAGLLARPAQATHIMGAELTYEYLNTANNCTTFRVFCAIYYDCSGSGTTLPPGSPPSPDGGFNFTSAPGNCALPTPLNAWTELSYLEVTPVCPGFATRCTSAAAAVNGVLQARHFRDYQFCNPAQNCVYTASWGSCCRNSTITSGSQQEAIYVSTTIQPGQLPANSSPVFSTLPVPYVCSGQQFVFSQGAFDPNGDVLSYALVPCSLSATQSVTYNGGYNATNSALGPTWTVAIDPQSGDVSLTPNPVGAQVTAVLCVEVTETRNGVVIGKVRRDIQITVIPCAVANTNPQIQPATALGTSTTSVSAYQVAGTACSPVVFEIPSLDPDPGQSFTMTWNQPATMQGAVFESVNLSPVQFNSISATTPPRARFSWTPTQPGTYSFVVTLKDNICPNPGLTQRTFLVHVAPFANAGPDKTLCLPGTTTIGVATPTATAYSWCNFTLGCPGNTTGISGSTTVATPTISLPGAAVGTTLYTYQLTATHPSGCVSTDKVDVTFVNPPDPSFTLTAGPYCTGSSVTLTNTTTASATILAGTTFSWNVNGGTISGGLPNNPVVTWSTAGNKTITLTATYKNCVKTTSQQITVYVIPVATFSMPNPVCTGQAVQPTFSGTTPVSSFTWTFGSAASVTNPTTIAPSVTWLTSGSAPCSLATVVNGCTSAPYIVQVPINTTPTASFTMPSPVCSGQIVQPTFTGSTPVSQYLWNFGTNATVTNPTSATPSVSWSTGVAVPCSLITVASGCSSVVATVPVTVNLTPTASFTAPTSICVNAPAQLTYTGTAIPGGTYQWSSAGATFTTATANPQVSWTTPGAKACSLSVVSAAGCTSAVSTKTIQVLGPQIPTFALNPNPVCLPTGVSSVSATGTYTGGQTGLSYLWNMGGATSPSGTQSTKTATWTAPGSYLVTLTVADGTGCQNSATQIQTIVAPAVTVAQSVSYSFGTGGTIATVTIQVSNITPTNQTFEVLYTNPAGTTVLSSSPSGFLSNGSSNAMFIAGNTTASVVLQLKLPDCTVLNNCVTARHQNLPACSHSSCIQLVSGQTGMVSYGAPGTVTNLSSLLGPGGIPNTLSGGKYYINTQNFGIAGVLNQDVAVDINNCTITMLGGSQWRISNSIDAFQTTFQGCGVMWMGFVENGDRRIQFNDQVTIADAEIGMDMYTAGPTTQIKKNYAGTFRNCYIGVRYRGTSTNNVTGKLTLDKTTFTSTLSFLLKYPGQLTPASGRPLAAIWLEWVSSYNLYGFRVEKHHAGICALNCSFTVQKLTTPGANLVQFDNIQPVIAYTPASTATPTMTPMPLEARGCGIYAEGGMRFAVTGNGGLASSPYTFQNCLFGVRTRNLAPTVQNCRMELGTPVLINGVPNPTTGVEVAMLGMPGKGAIAVTNNYLSATGKGVRMHNTENTLFSITNNTIRLAGTGGSLAAPTIGCIEVAEVASPKSAKSLISGNTLNAGANGSAGCYGIKLQGCQNKQVTYNDPIQLRGTFAYGIWLTGGSANSITANAVTGNNTTLLGKQYGFVVSNSSGNSIRCNVATTTTYGYEFNGTCTAKDMFVGNTIGSAYVGLRVTSGLMGTQTHTKNMWTGTYGSLGAEHLGATSVAYNQSKFWCNDVSSLPIGSTSFMPPVVGVNYSVWPTVPQWIESQNAGNTSEYCAGIAGFGPGTLDSTYYLLAAGLLQPETYPEEIRWAMAKDLFDLIEADSLIAAGDSAVMAYYHQLKSTTLASLTHVVQQYGEVNDEAAGESVQALWDDINARAGQIAALDSLIHSDTTQAGNYTATLDSLYALQNSQMELLTQLSEAQAALWVTDLSVIEGNNNAIHAPQVYEQNWKEVNRVYLASLRNGVVDPLETGLLQGIAAQCPIAGGPAVYAARTLYAHLANDPGYDDHNTCLEQGYQMRPGKDAETASPAPKQEMNLQPNPATESVSVHLNVPASGTLVLRTLSGQVLLEQTQPEAISSCQLDLQVVAAGVYVLEFKADNGVILFAKLCVQ